MKRFNEKKAIELIRSFCMSHKLKHGTTLYRPSGCVTETSKVLPPHLNFKEFKKSLSYTYELEFGCTPKPLRWFGCYSFSIIRAYFEIGGCDIDSFNKTYTLSTGPLGNVRKETFNY